MNCIKANNPGGVRIRINEAERKIEVGGGAKLKSGKGLCLIVGRGASGTPGQDGQDGTNGVDGVDGQNGIGLPTGGTAGQVPAKASGADYDIVWKSVTAILSDLPTYDSNEDAITDGLSVGDWYITSNEHNAAPGGLPIRIQ